MPRVKVIGESGVRAVPPPPGCASQGRVSAYLHGDAPLHLHRHELAQGHALMIGPGPVDALAYVWRGAVRAGGGSLPAGSSAIVEHGALIDLVAEADDTAVLVFAAAKPEGQRAGGHVHLLPASQVPRNPDLGSPGVGGAMHADAGCETCALWLHENHFAGSPGLSPEIAARGIHSHSEHEIIFVTEGEIRLGQKLFCAGTAVAIAADTLYSLSPGPDGLSFINFRAGRPGAIQFANGSAMDEPAYWRERLARPEYLEPA
jgi:hypothetical protein